LRSGNGNGAFTKDTMCKKGRNDDKRQGKGRKWEKPKRTIAQKRAVV